MTKRVNVSNGTLVLDATGGTQTKIDFVDAVPAAADPTDPVVTSSLAGTLSAGAGSPYVGPVTITASATDNVAVDRPQLHRRRRVFDPVHRAVQGLHGR